MWRPFVAALVVLAISIAILFYGWDLYTQSVPGYRGPGEVFAMILCFAGGGTLMLGSLGYLAAWPGLEFSKKGFKPKRSRYGRFVSELIGNCTTTCGVGYRFGFWVSVTCAGLAGGGLVVTLLVYTLGSAVVRNPLGSITAIGTIIGLMFAAVAGFFIVKIAIGWLTHRDVYRSFCPPRQFPRSAGKMSKF